MGKLNNNCEKLLYLWSFVDFITKYLFATFFWEACNFDLHKCSQSYMQHVLDGVDKIPIKIVIIQSFMGKLNNNCKKLLYLWSFVDFITKYLLPTFFWEACNFDLHKGSQYYMQHVLDMC